MLSAKLRPVIPLNYANTEEAARRQPARKEHRGSCHGYGYRTARGGQAGSRCGCLGEEGRRGPGKEPDGEETIGHSEEGGREAVG